MAEEEKTKTPITNEIATTSKDLDIFTGWLKRMENPDPVLLTESAGKGLKLYDEVDRDPHAGSVLQTRYLSVAGKEWEVLAADESSVAQEIADFVRSALDDVGLTKTIKELLQAILYGFYVVEIMWSIKDKHVVPSQIMDKHPRRFSFTMERELRLLTPQNMIEGEVVPDRKFVVFSWGTSDNPYGKGLGQKLWWPVWFKKNGIKFWLIFLEKFGMPTAVGKYPSGTSPEQQQALLDAIDAIQNETGVKIPETMAIDLLEAARTGKVTYETLCEYMDKQVSKAVLGQTASTEGTPGKLGNEQGQEEVRQDILKGDSDLVCEKLNTTLIPWIVDYNFPNVTAYPKLWLRTEPEKDLKELAERDKTLTNDIGLPVGKKYFYETYNIPEPEAGEELVESGNRGTGETGSRGIREAGNRGGGEFSDRQRFSPQQENVEGLVGRSMNRAGSAIAGLSRPVKSLIANANSLEEIRDGLYQTYSHMNRAEFEDLLARAMFIAELYGRAAVNGEM